MATKASTQGDGLDKVMFGYTTEVNSLENENQLLRGTVTNLRNELQKFQAPPHIICEVKDIVSGKAVIALKNGNEFHVSISSGVKGLKPGDLALCHQKHLTVIDKINVSLKFNIEKFVIVDKPTTSWKDIGGLSHQVNEIKEVIELPLKKPHLFKKVGIKPPKGILLHGQPGTGKTLLAKAVAASTKSTFVEIVAAELVQKFIGEGAKLVKEIFELARSKAPAIVFIDELDALAAKRVDIGTSGEREVQRTFMQLLAELDGFKPLDNVKVIGATNRKDILDPAVIRPGRLDRLINVPIPDEEGLKQIFNIHISGMRLDKGIKKSILIKKMHAMNGAEVRAVCTEAGYFAIRDNRSQINHKDFLDAIEKVRADEKREAEDYMNMYG